MTPDNLIATLDHLHNLRCLADLTASDREAARQAAIPAEVAAELSAIELEFAPQIEALAVQIAAVETEIKTMVEAAGTTVKGRGLQAVFTPGKVTYDARALDGLLIAMPEIAAFRREGKPSVSIRAVGK